MVNVGTLEGRLTLESRQFLKSLKDSQNRARSTTKRISSNFKGLNKVFAGVAASLAAIFTIRAARNFLDIGESLENLRTALITTEGGLRDANRALEFLSDISQETQFNITELGEGLRILGIIGLNTQENVEALANIATAMGTSVGGAAQALLSLESETLRLNFGLERVQRSGDEFIVTLQGGEKQIFSSTQAFRGFLLELGKTGRFAGAAARAAGLFGTEAANIVTQLQRLSLQFRDILGPVLGEVAELIKGVADRFEELSDAQKDAISDRILEGFRTIREDLVKIANLDFSNLSAFGKAVVGTATVVGVKTIEFSLRSILNLATSIGLSFIAIERAIQSINSLRIKTIIPIFSLGDNVIEAQTVLTSFREIAERIGTIVGRLGRLAPIIAIVGGMAKGLSDALGFSQQLRATFELIRAIVTQISFDRLIEQITNVLIPTIDAVSRPMRALITAAKLFSQFIELATEGAVALGIQLDILARKATFRDVGEELEVALERANRAIDETSSEIDQTVQDLADLFTRPLASGEDFRKLFADEIPAAVQNTTNSVETAKISFEQTGEVAEKTAKKIKVAYLTAAKTIRIGTEDEAKAMRKLIAESAETQEKLLETNKKLVNSMLADTNRLTADTNRLTADTTKLVKEMQKASRTLNDFKQGVITLPTGQTIARGDLFGLPSELELKRRLGDLEQILRRDPFKADLSITVNEQPLNEAPESVNILKREIDALLIDISQTTGKTNLTSLLNDVEVLAQGPGFRVILDTLEDISEIRLKNDPLNVVSEELRQNLVKNIQIVQNKIIQLIQLIEQFENSTRPEAFVVNLQTIANRLNQTLSELRGSFNQFGPTINAVTGQIDKMGAATQKFGNQLSGALLSSIRSLSLISDQSREVEQRLNKLAETFAKDQNVEELNAELRKLRAELQKAAEEALAAANSFKKTGDGAKAGADGVRELTEAVEESGSRFGFADRGASGLANSIRATADAAAVGARELANFNSTITQLRQGELTQGDPQQLRRTLQRLEAERTAIASSARPGSNLFQGAFSAQAQQRNIAIQQVQQALVDAISTQQREFVATIFQQALSQDPTISSAQLNTLIDQRLADARRSGLLDTQTGGITQAFGPVQALRF